MANITLKLCVDELEKADTNEVILKAMVTLKEFCANEDLTDIDSEIRLQILNSLGSNFFNLLRHDTVIDGERPEVVKGTLITVLSWFAKDKKFATHEKVIQVLPYIGKILTTFNDCLGEVCTKMIKESYEILRAISQHPVGVDEIIAKNVVNDLCFAAGAMKFGSSYAEQLLLDIIQSEQDDAWNYDNTDGVFYLVTRYVELIGQNDEMKWHYIDILKLFLYSWEPPAICIDWGNKLRGLIANLLRSKLHKDERNKVLELLVSLMTIFNIKWILEEGYAFLLRVVHHIALEIYQTLDGKTGMKIFADTHLPGYYHILWLILGHMDSPGVQLINEQCSKLYDAMKIAISATCGSMKRMSEHDSTCKADKTEHKSATSHECIRQDSYDKAKVAETNNNDVNRAQQGRWKNTNYHILRYVNIDTCSEIPDEAFLLIPMYVLVTWYLRSQKAPCEIIIGAIPILLKVSRYALHILQDERRQIAQGDSDAPLDHLWYVVPFFHHMMKTSESRFCFLQEQLPCFLEEYLNYHWIEFNKAQSIIRAAKSNLPKSSENEGKNELVPTETNVKPASDKTIDIRFFLRRVENSDIKMRAIMGFLINNVIETMEFYKIGNELCEKLWKFAMTNLPYLETRDEFTATAFHVMTMGLMTCERLASANKTPSEGVAMPFLEASLNLLGGVCELQTTKSEPAAIQVTSRFRRSWGSLFKCFVICMSAIPKYLIIFPALSRLIVETDWIVDILNMLKCVKAKKLEEWQNQTFDTVLSSCASYNAACKSVIQQNSGMLIARQLRLSLLQHVLSSRVKVEKSGRK